jgi:FkbM family methyltransferase
VWVRDCYKARENIEQGSTIIDIGSNTGFFSILASKLCGEGKVYSIEAYPLNFKKLKKNIEINSIRNIEPFNFFIGSSNNIRKLGISNENEGNCGGYTNDLDKKIIEVQGKTLNNLIKENQIGKIDFMKVDCEGAEYEIFETLGNKTFENIKLLAMEIHYINGKNPFELIGLFKRKGFSVEILEHEPNKNMLIFAKKKTTPKRKPRGKTKRYSINYSRVFGKKKKR